MMHAHPDIDEACVIATKDARKGEAVKVFIVARDPNNPPEIKKLKEWVSAIWQPIRHRL